MERVWSDKLDCHVARTDRNSNVAGLSLGGGQCDDSLLLIRPDPQPGATCPIRSLCRPGDHDAARLRHGMYLEWSLRVIPVEPNEAGGECEYRQQNRSGCKARPCEPLRLGCRGRSQI